MCKVIRFFSFKGFPFENIPVYLHKLAIKDSKILSRPKYYEILTIFNINVTMFVTISMVSISSNTTPQLAKIIDHIDSNKGFINSCPSRLINYPASLFLIFCHPISILFYVSSLNFSYFIFNGNVNASDIACYNVSFSSKASFSFCTLA